MSVAGCSLICPLAAVALCYSSHCSLSLPVDYAPQRSNWIQRSGLGGLLHRITAIAEGEPRQLP
jgi:hypothetical protein